MVRVAVVLSALALAGCGTTPTARAQAVDLRTEITLAPGETVSVNATEMKVRFVAVIEDSRCPRDVTCVWAGEVKVRLEISSPQGTSQVEVLEAGTTVAGVYRVTLVRVEPPRMSTAKIAPQDYRATLSIDRAG
jgi:hypothetical protein